ncbi:hypothetical protein [Bifidobacterium cebidarum]|uniref:Lipoprotein n=1 Tax=Bifidobacterium cebidarum TaxID=2650773 RepID=A0A6I1GET3_9BIFI|nr:hypothetical protein [Bifidobacterium cebidarum]KAB7789192.1 hypothetical protein F7D08_0144 [Bifidobacterium cebidarum]
MNNRSRMMLYALTAVACVVWIYQSVKESMSDGTIISTSNIIFLVCIGIAAVYCAANALIIWWRQPGKDDETSSENAEDEDSEDEPEDSQTDADSSSATQSPQAQNK